ncbi:helix-turn-helix domain-containing protein [Streptomyces pristinaespiralis]|uniref:helix-turn-helix domain-containing protein n=1 Tax=Streptomyces pristinaespiralis TaxID=38300 RepID=UPI0037A1B9E0
MPVDPPPWAATCSLIGRRVRARRLYQNVTQEKLYELTGISVDTIQRIESGRHDPKVSYLCRIAAVLEVDVADFFAAEPVAEGFDYRP